MSQSPNPYIAGSPVTGPEMFFGREDVFTFVRQALTGQHRDHVLVLYGQRRTGKTSVLYQMSRHLGERYVCIFIDLHGLALSGLGGFLWELANHIARVLRRDYQVNLPPLDRAAFQDEPRSAFENTFLDDVWEAIGDRHLLLMLDEAIRLEEQVQAGKLEIQVFQYLRHLMQHYPRLNFLFSLGSGLEEMQEEYAFLFNVALYKKISFLDRLSAQALITQPVEDRCPFQPAAVERILEVTSGHPYFTQLICHSLFNRCVGGGGVTVSDVEAVLDEAVERGLAVLKHVWEESTPGEKAVLAAIAAAESESPPSGAAAGDTGAEDGIRTPIVEQDERQLFAGWVRLLDSLGLHILAKKLKQFGEKIEAFVRPASTPRAAPDDPSNPSPSPSPGTVHPDKIIRTWAERGVALTESEASRAVRRLVARDVITGAGEYAFTVDLMRLWVQRFRRLEWVKEEIEEAIQSWVQKEQEQRDRQEQQQLSKQALPPLEIEARPHSGPSRSGSTQAAQTSLSMQGAVVQEPGKSAKATRNRFNLSILSIILGLAGLLAIVYFASELLGLGALVPVSPANPAETQTTGASGVLRGEAAKVTDMAFIEGFVWATTDAGLVRWSTDGSSTLYPVDDLGLDCINTIAVRPSDETLWLGCGGVAVARLERDGASYFGFYDRDSGLGMGVVRALAVDPRGDIWAGGAPTQGRPPPLTVFSGSSDQPWTHVEQINDHLNTIFASSPESININAIYFDSEDSIWLGLREAGIVHISDQGAVHYPLEAGGLLDSFADLRIRRILVDQNGTVWAAASDKGLLRFRAEDDVWVQVELDQDRATISTVAEFEDGSLWAGGDQWVMRSGDGGETWIQVGTEEGLGEEVVALVQDDTGQVWAGAFLGGVSVWDGQSWSALQK